MKETFERVADHLYRRQYQTAGGEWRLKFYGIFTDWTGKRRKMRSRSIWLETLRERIWTGIEPKS
jgi:hypothetical protein